MRPSNRSAGLSGSGCRRGTGGRARAGLRLRESVLALQISATTFPLFDFIVLLAHVRYCPKDT